MLHCLNFQRGSIYMVAGLDNIGNKNKERGIFEKNPRKIKASLLKTSDIKFYNLDPCLSGQIGKTSLPTEQKSPFDFQRSFKKALSGQYKGILFGENILENEKGEAYLQQSLKNGLTPAIQITIPSFFSKQDLIQKYLKRYGASLFFNMIFEDVEKLPWKNLKASLSQFFFTYVVTKKNQGILFKQKIPKESLEKIEVLFPYKEHFFDPFLTPPEVYKFIKKQGPLKSYQREIYDSRIAQDMDLEPLTKPLKENSSLRKFKKIVFSIIIPSHNNKNQLKHTLKALAEQEFPRNKYEIIIVDDGSADQTKRAVKNFMEQYPSLNMKMIFFPRVVEKKQGDNRFRAGIARNLGVKHSEGEILAFLDSDILTPASYLRELEKEHKEADVILLKRYHLKPKAPINYISFEPQRLKKWHYIEEKHYWGAFYEKGFENVKCPWKYICTYGLSLSKMDFQEAGAFGKNFVFYGFEDTDLGYRLFKKNKKFLLSSIKVYHQAPEEIKKSYNLLKRDSQLSKTAKIFFYKHLDPEIYEELKTYMSQDRGFFYFFPFLKKSR